MGFVARGRWGGHESNPPVERLREILQELDIETEDFEHPDVSLKHRFCRARQCPRDRRERAARRGFSLKLNGREGLP